MLNIHTKYNTVLLEALEDLMYKLSLQLNELKGEPMDKRRRELTEKQKAVEELQHLISLVANKSDSV